MKTGDWIQPKNSISLLNFLRYRGITSKEIDLFLKTRFIVLEICSDASIRISFKKTQLSRCLQLFNHGLVLLENEYKEPVGQMLLFDLTDTDSTDDITVNE